MSRPIVAWAAALLAVGSAVLHGGSLPGVTSPWLAALTVAMVAGCLFCAYELLTRDTVRAWVLVAVMNLAMIGAHLPMPAGHHHGGLGAAGAASLHPATVVAVLEVALAAAVLFLRTRALAPTVGAACQSGPHDLGASPGRQVGRNLDRLPESG
ncbi:hypothetical protein [Mycolicibacterium chlorophenolicum]|uniref:Uncharacterized protein n=1 Tax=Mycolicibacterium chlorophenolicum TaxID=37916 RepID=A0A0J6YBS2_9MYCO|nr:hypothetical protein [Mycolicibacterium chlorophenolicum]KMO70271.1 hypothetical protein MCHLDSM_05159 [Mycolicibacterium chlorophenolicum]